jgi:hypothetical protein
MANGRSLCKKIGWTTQLQKEGSQIGYLMEGKKIQ